MAIDFESVFDTLKNGVVNVAAADLGNYIPAAAKDGQSVLDGIKTDLAAWTEALANGAITKEDFAYNVASEKDSIEMTALKEAGLAEIAADQFKTDLLNFVTTTISALIP